MGNPNRPSRLANRNPERGARILAHAQLRTGFSRDPELVSREAMRDIDRRMAMRSPRSWLQRLDDRMQASILVEAAVWGVLGAGCVLAVVLTLILVRLKDAGFLAW